MTDSPYSPVAAHTHDGPVLLFDDDCGFCRRSVVRLQRHGALKGTVPVAWQTLDPDHLPVPVERLEREVVLVHGTEIRGGASALADAMVGATPAWRLVGAFLHAPVVRNLAAYVYRHVAANRYRMPGGTAACRIPSAQAD